MISLGVRKSLNIFLIIEKIKSKIRKILFFKYYNKKREIIRECLALRKKYYYYIRGRRIY